MQAKERLKPYLIEDRSDHVKIRSRLNTTFSYHDEAQEKWRTITNFADPNCTQDRLEIRCSHARQVLSLPYPFKLDGDFFYLWGLITGSAHRKKQLEIRVDANQEGIIQAVSDQLGMQVQVTPIHRVRRKRGSLRPPSRYRKIQVQFPYVFAKFLHCLGHRAKRPRIPGWLNEEQRLAWVEGYLNSPKMQGDIRKGEEIHPRVFLYIARNDRHLLDDITAVLDQLSISHSVHCYQGRLRISIHKQPNILALANHFVLRRPKMRALIAIVRQSRREPALRFTLQKFRLTEDQLTHYGTILDQPLQELEYTLFEETFANSSNELRHDLYLLDRMGLISYYKKENNKEFFIRSTKYLHYIQKMLSDEERRLRRQLKLTDRNALSFHCCDCNQVIGYTEAMGEISFACPHCASRNLKAIELSRYFYQGHLGQIAHQRNVLTGGIS